MQELSSRLLMYSCAKHAAEGARTQFLKLALMGGIPGSWVGAGAWAWSVTATMATIGNNGNHRVRFFPIRIKLLRPGTILALSSGV
jgi:hypothetical protein